MKALLVDVVEIELEGCLYRDVKDAKKAFGKAEAEASNAQTKYKLQKHVVSRNQGEHLQVCLLPVALPAYLPAHTVRLFIPEYCYSWR